ncbi:putative RNA methyltransferase [Smaragdicoccus niigatensis]|uniref:putative RNA methyltransferase n=1 Tax=Smaragdicoccus niigatensis TaxID=359359 RepID=UPI000361B8F0|nr:methyltransferase domain-containing protein [Smaragdicoccus niigatensis]
MSLDLVVDRLRCPVCAGALAVESAAVRCASGHSFDIARDGYVTLLGGGGTKVFGDTPAMLAARADFLAAGHYQPIADAVSHAMSDATSILEIGAGTGYYLGQALDAQPSAVGLGFDVSKASARRIARAHTRAAAVVADAWRDWPFADDAFSHVMSVFAPRNAAEIARVLASGGAYVVVTPQSDHLVELLDRVRVDQDKAQRLAQTLEGRFVLESAEDVRFVAEMTAAEAGQAVAMGPSGHHLDVSALRALVSSLPEMMHVTVAVNVGTYRAV